LDETGLTSFGSVVVQKLISFISDWYAGDPQEAVVAIKCQSSAILIEIVTASVSEFPNVAQLKKKVHPAF